jgi:hypothetical protein
MCSPATARRIMPDDRSNAAVRLLEPAGVHPTVDPY